MQSSIHRHGRVVSCLYKYRVDFCSDIFFIFVKYGDHVYYKEMFSLLLFFFFFFFCERYSFNSVRTNNPNWRNPVPLSGDTSIFKDFVTRNNIKIDRISRRRALCRWFDVRIRGQPEFTPKSDRRHNETRVITSIYDDDKKVYINAFCRLLPFRTHNDISHIVARTWSRFPRADTRLFLNHKQILYMDILRMNSSIALRLSEYNV